MNQDEEFNKNFSIKIGRKGSFIEFLGKDENTYTLLEGELCSRGFQPSGPKVIRRWAYLLSEFSACSLSIPLILHPMLRIDPFSSLGANLIIFATSSNQRIAQFDNVFTLSHFMKNFY
jgi:hypothetical protein